MDGATQKRGCLENEIPSDCRLQTPRRASGRLTAFNRGLRPATSSNLHPSSLRAYCCQQREGPSVPPYRFFRNQRRSACLLSSPMNWQPLIRVRHMQGRPRRLRSSRVTQRNAAKKTKTAPFVLKRYHYSASTQSHLAGVSVDANASRRVSQQRRCWQAATLMTLASAALRRRTLVELGRVFRLVAGRRTTKDDVTRGPCPRAGYCSTPADGDDSRVGTTR